MKVSEYNSLIREQVDKVNAHMQSEIGRYNVQVDETLASMVRWQYDKAELLGDSSDVTVTLEIPRGLLLAMARGQQDVAQFAVARVTFLLQVELQKAVNNLLGPRDL
jgi:hypothetical protein